jgi:hypothetical protein
MLQFNSDWRFDSPGGLSTETYRGFCELMRPIITPNARWVYEHFKDYFAAASGSTASPSSSTSWAETDMNAHMSAASENAPLFIEAFYDACESLPEMYPNPGVARINKVLAQTQSGWTIQLPNLIRLGEAEPVQVEELPQQLDITEKDVIQTSLSKSQRLLAENSNRLAVQEIIWLLETVSTVFEGVETREGIIEGKYFNTIIKDLRRLEKGRTLEQTLDWIRTLHGYLSSPSGGGIRHGATLSDATAEIEPNEARLYCNLIRSYIVYLLAEHRRLTGN